MSARIWWLGDVPLGAGNRGIDSDLKELQEKWLMQRTERNAEVQRIYADSIRSISSAARPGFFSDADGMHTKAAHDDKRSAPREDGSNSEDEVHFRLRKRRAELYRTEVYTYNSLAELIEKLQAFRATMMVGGGSNLGTGALRKRDMVREALVGGVTSVTSLLGGAAAKRTDSSVDPYTRMSLPRGLLPVNEVENSIVWDIRVLDETLDAGQELLPVHDRLRLQLECACVQDSLEPVWRAFIEVGNELKVHIHTHTHIQQQ